MKRSLVGTMLIGLAMTVGIPAVAFASGAPSPDLADDSEPVIVTSPIVRPETADPELSGRLGSRGTTEAAAVCTFFGKLDYAHISKTSSNLAVQSHGGWINGDCKATLADVTVGVMKKNTIGIFVDVGRLGKKRLASGEWGSSHWAVGHYDCKGSSTHSFQSWVDVDLVGYSDWINKTFSPPTSLACD